MGESYRGAWPLLLSPAEIKGEEGDGRSGWSEYTIDGGRRKSVIALAMRTRLPYAMMPISVLRRLTSSSRRTSPVISCSVHDEMNVCTSGKGGKTHH